MEPVRRPNRGWAHGLFHDANPVVATDRLIREHEYHEAYTVFVTERMA